MGTRGGTSGWIGGIFAAALLAPAAHAVDGVFEINHACALAGTCFPGDAPGHPVTINRGVPASYRLTSTLDIADPNVTAIEIVDANVSIDLNGFAISGPNVCSGVPLECTASGSGYGIAADAPGITVKNGVVRGMGSRGVSLGTGAHVEDVLAVSNGVYGFEVGPESLVRRCRAIRNGDGGIFAPMSQVSANVVIGNGRAGIITGVISTGGAMIRDNVVRDHSQHGGLLHAADAYVGNVFRSNTPEVAGGIQIGGNLCGAAICP